MLNWDMLKNPLNYIVLTLMVLIGLIAFDAVKRWIDAHKAGAVATATHSPASGS
jgi:hypothetical protein